MRPPLVFSAVAIKKRGVCPACHENHRHAQGRTLFGQIRFVCEGCGHYSDGAHCVSWWNETLRLRSLAKENILYWDEDGNMSLTPKHVA